MRQRHRLHYVYKRKLAASSRRERGEQPPYIMPLRRSQRAASHSTHRRLSSCLPALTLFDSSDICIGLEITAPHGCGDPLVVICAASLPRRRELLQRSTAVARIRIARRHPH